MLYDCDNGSVIIKVTAVILGRSANSLKARMMVCTRLSKHMQGETINNN